MKSHRLKFLVIGLLSSLVSVKSAFPDYGSEFVDSPAIDSYQVQLQSEPASPLDYEYSVDSTINATEEVAMTTMIPDYIQQNRTEEDEPITNNLYMDESEMILETENLSAVPQPKGRSFDINETSDEEDILMGAMLPVATTTQSLYHPQILPSVDASPPVFYPQPTITTVVPSVVAPASATSSPATTAATRSKQGKKIHIKKLLPHEQLRNYIEDAYIRMPLAVIVDPSPAALDKTKNLWGDTLRSNMAIKIVLVSLNSSGEYFFTIMVP